MKNPDDELSEKHIGDRRVAYMENLLTPSEMSAVEKHVQTCADCRSELEDLKRWENTLRTNKDSMCPEQWELFDYARDGKDPGGKLRAHLDGCALCRSDVVTFAEEPLQGGVPSELWERIAGFYLKQDKQTIRTPGESYLSKLATAWSRFFHFPVLATSAVAVVVLMVVLFYPTSRNMQPVVGLSSVQWHIRLMRPGEMPPVRKAIVPKKDRLAMVIFFKGFDKAPSREQIDSLYRSLKPTAALLSRFNVVSPLAVKQTVEENQIGVIDRDNLFKLLYEKLGANRIVLLTIYKRGALFDIEAQLADSSNLKTLRSLDVRRITEADLAAKLKESTVSALEMR